MDLGSVLTYPKQLIDHQLLWPERMVG